MTTFCSSVKRSFAVFVILIALCIMFNQQVHSLTILSSSVKRSFVIRVDQIQVCITFNQQVHVFFMTALERCL